ncbi:MAG: redox-regulated ATPase YchF [Planctomycetota bacterium]
MEAGIVGLPNVGKSTLFNSLTSAGIASENYPFCTIEPNVGAVPVPDPRLDQIQSHITTQKVIPAVLRLVDIAGIVRGASEGEGLGNKFLSHIRSVDAILHVVRCFEDLDVTHVDGGVDPLRDIETIDTELMLADLQSVESMTDKATRTARSGDKEAKQRLVVLEACQGLLAEGKPVRGLSFEDPALAQAFAEMQLLTSKRVLYVANVDEGDLTGEGPHVASVRKRAEDEGGAVVPVCARLEAELAELEAEERAEMLESLGLQEPALAALARAAYELLGLQSYFTAGEKEVRAWTIPIGSLGPQAAGVIHSDFERGFIRAEVYSVNDLEELGSEKAIRDAGRMRVEGKEYVVQDGDVCHFLFNV